LKRWPAAGLAAVPRHLFSLADLGRDGILAILDRAADLRARPADRTRFSGKILGLLFFQPSTRTRFGFHAAIARAGGAAIELDQLKHQPGMTRPESLPDTVRCIAPYCDTIVLRHSEGAAVEEAMRASTVPVVNGGSGLEHHPTQTLIDLYTIRRQLGRLDRLSVGIAGNLATSRSARSLIQALAAFPPTQLRLMVPTGGLPSGLLPADLPITPAVIHTLDLAGLDVLYMAGFPESSDGTHGERQRASLRLTVERARALEPSAVVLDPLPRIDEIEPLVDALPQARYFEQSANGLEVRAAVLDWFLTASG
jgi:aspartate carbamoyltransferase catalytic subunit